ncbi:type 2 lanthipeptide synthetase LanM family protein [Lysinibacillus sp. NPDC094403]|uniref:type 2 lanthipeptide synthetase LanM family protein n=1 Tax=Lysinibacillus sp. NPDC094403 TaxID=3390581 RepID=UPI003D0886DD
MRNAIDAIKKSLYIHERKINDIDNIALGEARIKFWSSNYSPDTELEEFYKVNKVISNIEKGDLFKLSTHETIQENIPLNKEEWFQYIDELFSEKYSHIKIPKPFLKYSPKDNLHFIGFIQPFLRTAMGRLGFKMNDIIKKNELNISPINNEIEIIILYQLISQLIVTCYRTVVLELNVARVSGKLKGDTSEERYKYFEEVMLNDTEYLKSIYTEYPVLTRLMAIKCEQWINNIIEIFDRLENDKHLLSQKINDGKELGHLKNIQMGLSDSHCGGRTVSILTFDSGFKVVYKPRPLGIDVQFQAFLKFFNQHQERDLYHYEMKVVNCNTYGWVEFIEEKPCITKDEIERFYWRIGSQLALLNALSATDFHYENLIASGEYPVLVDLESLFHQQYSQNPQIKTAYQKATHIIGNSVLSTGILPSLVTNKENNADLSGLGEVKEQLYPKKVSIVEDKNTDIMQVVRNYVKISGGNNTPSLNENKVNVVDYIENIGNGFRDTYHWLINNKEIVKTQIKLFFNIEVRHILRATERYGELLNISTHPDFLRDSLDREMLLNKLWIDSIARPELMHAMNSEKKDLLQGDIPYFTSKPSEIHLWDSEGRCIENFFEKDCLSITLDKIESLNLEDCQEQLNVIRLSMLAIDSKEERNKNRFIPSIDSKNGDYIPEDFLVEAIKIGDYLLSKSISGINEEEIDLGWIGTNLVGINEVQWRLAPVGIDLYDGVSGMAIFYGYLAKVTGEIRFKEAAKRSLIPVRRALNYISSEVETPDIGAFTGMGSCIYALQHLAEILQEPELLDEISSFLPKLIKMIPKDEALDIIGGSAGTLIILLDFYRLTGNELALKGATLCGERLLEVAEPMGDNGVGWRVSVSSDPLAGFAHGVAGISWALSELAAVTRDCRFSDIVHEALIYERSLFLEESKNWAKLIEKDGKVPAAWCHGASGIVLSRLLLLGDNVKDTLLQEEIRVGLETTLKEGFGADHSLCHGDFGNIDILRFASDVLKEEKWRKLAEDAAITALLEIKTKGRRCGLSRNCETTGLMVGLAGIGFGLLRQYDPISVPSIIRLQPPIEMPSLVK